MFRVRPLACAAMALMVLGCQGPGPKSATTETTEKIDKMRARPKSHYTNMVDNAVLHDLSLTDIHFVPHTSELSGSGVAKLDRMAPMLDTYGGVVHYDTDLVDATAIQARIQHARDYLALTGCAMDKVEIKPGLAQGRGTPAERALKIEQREMNPKPKSGGMAPGGPAPIGS